MLGTIFIIWLSGFAVSLLGFFAVVGIQDGAGIPTTNASGADVFWSCVFWYIVGFYWIFYFIGHVYRKRIATKRAAEARRSCPL